MSYDCPPTDNHIGLKSTAAFCAAVKHENKMLHNSSKPLLGLVPSTESTYQISYIRGMGQPHFTFYF